MQISCLLHGMLGAVQYGWWPTVSVMCLYRLARESRLLVLGGVLDIISSKPNSSLQKSPDRIYIVSKQKAITKHKLEDELPT